MCGVAIDHRVSEDAELPFAVILCETFSSFEVGVRARCGIFSRSA
jgi:hypothetical protein